MTAEQHALWVDPHWTEHWTEGDRVRSRFTGNTGTVTRVVVGRHLLIHWEKWLRSEPDGYTARHSSDLGLVREP